MKTAAQEIISAIYAPIARVISLTFAAVAGRTEGGNRRKNGGEVRKNLRRITAIVGVCLLAASSAVSEERGAAGGFLYSDFLQNGYADAPSSAFLVEAREQTVAAAVGDAAVREFSDIPLRDYALGYLFDDLDVGADFSARAKDGFWRLSKLTADELLQTGLEDAFAAGFVRKAGVDFGSKLGNERPAYAALDFVGALRESADDAVAWHLRGFVTGDNSHGGNIDLIYRRVLEENFLVGAYIGYDYENSDDAETEFSRVAMGLEARSKWFDFFFNHYFEMTDDIARSFQREAYYSPKGYDAEVNFRYRPWLIGALGIFDYRHYDLENNFRRLQRHDRNGLSFALRLLRPFKGGKVEAELEYEYNYVVDTFWDGDVGGRLQYLHTFGEGDASSAAVGGGEFRAQDYFFEPPQREYTQILNFERPRAPFTYRMTQISVDVDGVTLPTVVMDVSKTGFYYPFVGTESNPIVVAPDDANDSSIVALRLTGGIEDPRFLKYTQDMFVTTTMRVTGGATTIIEVTVSLSDSQDNDRYKISVRALTAAHFPDTADGETLPFFVSSSSDVGRYILQINRDAWLEDEGPFGTTPRTNHQIRGVVVEAEDFDTPPARVPPLTLFFCVFANDQRADPDITTCSSERLP